MSTTQTKTAAAMVAEAKARIENLRPARVASEIEGAKALLVDIREADERAQNGVIKGAVHAPCGMIEFYADPPGQNTGPRFSPARRLSSSAPPGARPPLPPTNLRRSATGRVATS